MKMKWERIAEEKKLRNEDKPLEIDHLYAYLNEGRWPLGRYRGLLFSSLHTNYLRWVTKNVTEPSVLVRVAQKELSKRGYAEGKW